MEKVESTPRQKDLKWLLIVDETSGTRDQGVGIVLYGLKWMEMAKSIKFHFQVTNNVAKYEALIA